MGHINPFVGQYLWITKNNLSNSCFMIHSFHDSQYTLFAPQILQLLFWEYAVLLREFENNSSLKIWGANKVYNLWTNRQYNTPFTPKLKHV